MQGVHKVSTSQAATCIQEPVAGLLTGTKCFDVVPAWLQSGFVVSTCSGLLQLAQVWMLDVYMYRSSQLVHPGMVKQPCWAPWGLGGVADSPGN